MKILIRFSITLTCVCMLAVACERDDLTRVGRPPVVQGIAPSNRLINTFVGDTLHFAVRAFDPDKDSSLDRHYALDDSIVASGETWTYVVDDTGRANVYFLISDGVYSSRIIWSVNRFVPVNYPPVITSFTPLEAAPVAIVGSLVKFGVEAFDPESDDLSFTITVDGQVISLNRDVEYLAANKGKRTVRASVSDGAHSVHHTWNLTITDVPDTIPPARVPITLVETGVEPGEVILEWTAVGRDNNEGLASEYLVRTSPVPILTGEDWNRASERPGVPAPAQPGETMSMVLTDLVPGRYTHVAVRALDDFGNLSPPGESPGVYTRGMKISGTVRDAVSGDPIEGVIVNLGHFQTFTDAVGRFDFIELPPLIDAIDLLDESVAGSTGAYMNMSIDYEIKHLDDLDLFLIPDLPLVTQEYVSFYVFLRSMTDINGIPPKTEQRRWQLPIDLYVAPFFHNGLDYCQTIKDVSREFDSILGVPIFNLVDAVPNVGVSVVYNTGIAIDFYGVTQWSADYYPVQGRITHRTTYTSDTVSLLKLVSRHELGHAIGLQHSLDTFHLMIGGQTPRGPWFSNDELNIIKAYCRIPRGFDLRNYVQE